MRKASAVNNILNDELKDLEGYNEYGFIRATLLDLFLSVELPDNEMELVCYLVNKSYKELNNG